MTGKSLLVVTTLHINKMVEGGRGEGSPCLFRIYKYLSDEYFISKVTKSFHEYYIFYKSVLSMVKIACTR